MTTTTVYTSPAGGEDPGVWMAYSVTSNPSPAPFDILISVVPLVAPPTRWNLAGWACLTYLLESTIAADKLIAIPLLPNISTQPFQAFPLSDVPRSASRVPTFRSVRWNLNEWLGKCRVEIRFRT